MMWKRLRGEIDAHIEEKALDLIDSGMPREEAWTRARREFGNATLSIESSREIWILTWLERLWQDLVYAQRVLTKHAGVTAIAVLSLGVGVGANCATFSLADALLLRPLPVPNPAGVLTVGSMQTQGAAESLKMSYPDFRDFEERNRSFEQLAAFSMRRVRLTEAAGPAELRSSLIISGNFFSAMQVSADQGRVFLPSENEVPNRDAVMVLSHAFWQTQLGSDPGVVGRTARVEGIDFTVVGVLPPAFTGVDQWVQPDFYLPAMMEARISGGRPALDDRASRTFDVKGRLREGIDIEQAQAETQVLGSALAAEHPETNRDFTIRVRTELQTRLEEGRITGPIVGMLMLLSLAVLLVACANVAGLLTSRAPARAREMSIRLAIGAGRSRLVRQLLTESMILALLGGLAGIGVGYAGVSFLKQMKIVAEVPVALSFRLDERALLFSMSVALASVFLFGIWPARTTARADLAGALRAGRSSLASASGGPRHWTRNILVASQVSLSIVVLTVAAIMYVTFQRDLLAGPGFGTDHLLLARFDTSLAGYNGTQTRNFYRDLRELVRAIPGVRSASIASGLPGRYDLETLSVIPEHYNFPEGQASAIFTTTRADEHYFEAMGLALIRGRPFTSADDAESTPVAVINEVAAQRYWPNQDPIGKRLRLDKSSPWREIVGVSRNMKFSFLVETPRLALYVPLAQSPSARVTLALEAGGDPANLAAPLREAVQNLNTNVPIYDVRSMQDAWNANAVRPSLLIIQMIAAMGCMGVLLSLTGLYGMMAHSVSARRREIGIRMAIGADQGDVLGMVLREAVVLAGGGTAFGLVLGLVAGRLMVAAFPSHLPSAVIYAAVIPTVFVITMLAAYFPARRASRISPVSVLSGD